MRRLDPGVVAPEQTTVDPSLCGSTAPTGRFAASDGASSPRRTRASILAEASHDARRADLGHLLRAEHRLGTHGSRPGAGKGGREKGIWPCSQRIVLVAG